MIHPRTKSTSLVYIALTIIMCGALSVPSSAEAMELPQAEQEVAEYAKSIWLEPVVASIRRKSHDPSLLGLLDRIQLWTRKGDFGDLRPDAYAQMLEEGNRPIIYINLQYLIRAFRFADLAGLALTGRSDVEPILYAAGFAYGQAIAKAKENGEGMPTFDFTAKEYVRDPALRAMVKRLSMEAFLSGVAWVVLHEIAHHRLGHTIEKRRLYDECTAGNMEACRESRKRELEADRWAFATMRRLGYSSAPLHAFLMANEVVQEIRLAAGVETAEGYSTHPSYSTRCKELQSLWDTSKPAKGSFLVILTFALDDLNQVHQAETYIPRYPETDGWLYAIQGPVMMPCEWKDGKIYIYGRSQDRLTVMIVEEPDSLKPDITFLEKVAGESRWTESKTKGIQLDYAWAQYLTVGPFIAAGILETSPRILFRNVLKQLECAPVAANAAERIYMAQLSETRKVLIRYAQGRIELQAAQARVVGISTAAAARLESTLGAVNYKKFRDLIYQNPMVNFGLDRLMKRKQ